MQPPQAERGRIAARLQHLDQVVDLRDLIQPQTPVRHRHQVDLVGPDPEQDAGRHHHGLHVDVVGGGDVLQGLGGGRRRVGAVQQGDAQRAQQLDQIGRDRAAARG